MKLLVVDNITINMHDLTSALKDYEYDLINYKKVNLKKLKQYDKIILSGGHAFSVLHPNKSYKKELELIITSKKSILGICLGFQLICKAYGAKMGSIHKYEKGILKIKRLKNDSLLKGIPKQFTAYENHRHIVKSTSKKLINLAESKDGIEMIRHVSKPIWGTQFHPEKHLKRNVGRKILKNFLEN